MEQSIALYDNLTVIFGIVAAVFLVVSVILYFAFDMRSIISKRLGLTVKKELKRMQADAEAAEKAARKRVQGARAVSSNSVGSTESKKKPESILATLAAEQENERMMQEAMAATVSKNAGYTGGPADSETTKLDFDSETTQLGFDEETSRLAGDISEQPYSGGVSGSWQQRQFTEAPDGMELAESGDTVVLHQEAETAVLSQNASAYSSRQFMLVRHIMLIHTDEVIA